MIAPSPTPAHRRVDMHGHIADAITIASLGALTIAAILNPVIWGLLWLPVEWVREFWWLVVGAAGVWWWGW